MPEKQAPKLYPQDYVLRATVLPFIPEFVQPNHITVARMLMTPIILWLLWTGEYVVAFPLFVLAAFSDAVDGALARTRNEITPWGIFFDPVADKLLVGSVALLVALQYFHPWLVFLAIFLDMLPSIRWASKKFTGGLMAANKWGKAKMVLQCLSLGFLLLGITLGVPGLETIGEYLFGISIMFAMIALATYSL
jgi:CDP-diacylglycerol---glycerol-3-phosphate 3-phosphatidyltransferase